VKYKEFVCRDALTGVFFDHLVFADKWADTARMKKALVIIASQGYQDVELKGVRDGLYEAGFKVILGSTEAGGCFGKFGGKEVAQMAIRDVRVGDYDRIVFIGGPGASMLAEEEDVLQLAKNTVQAGKPLGAICIAPTILAAAGILRGKRATVWDEEGEQINLLKKAGAHYTGEAVTIDGTIITANGPDAAVQFAKIFAEM
jgi:protease I